MERTSLSHKPVDIATLLLRIAIALALLSAVADRFGLWGHQASRASVGATWPTSMPMWPSLIGSYQRRLYQPWVGPRQWPRLCWLWACSPAGNCARFLWLVRCFCFRLPSPCSWRWAQKHRSTIPFSRRRARLSYFSQSKQHAKTPNHPMKPTAPDQVNVSNLATNPARGLSLCRSAKRCLGVLA